MEGLKAVYVSEVQAVGVSKLGNAPDYPLYEVPCTGAQYKVTLPQTLFFAQSFSFPEIFKALTGHQRCTGSSFLKHQIAAMREVFQSSIFLEGSEKCVLRRHKEGQRNIILSLPFSFSYILLGDNSILNYNKVFYNKSQGRKGRWVEILSMTLLVIRQSTKKYYGWGVTKQLGEIKTTSSCRVMGVRGALQELEVLARRSSSLLLLTHSESFHEQRLSHERECRWPRVYLRAWSPIQVSSCSLQGSYLTAVHSRPSGRCSLSGSGSQTLGGRSTTCGAWDRHAERLSLSLNISYVGMKMRISPVTCYERLDPGGEFSHRASFSQPGPWAVTFSVGTLAPVHHDLMFNGSVFGQGIALPGLRTNCLHRIGKSSKEEKRGNEEWVKRSGKKNKQRTKEKKNRKTVTKRQESIIIFCQVAKHISSHLGRAAAGEAFPESRDRGVCVYPCPNVTLNRRLMGLCCLAQLGKRKRQEELESKSERKQMCSFMISFVTFGAAVTTKSSIQPLIDSTIGQVLLKDLMTQRWAATDHNVDNTTEILREWLKNVQRAYHYVEWRPMDEPDIHTYTPIFPKRKLLHLDVATG
eukprot:bmy_12545T0